ncbi:MAG: nitroreductase family protein [Patescibacteria group bacterium]
MEFFDLIKKRQSIRVFQEKLVEEEKVKKILQAANSAPSAGNLQAYKIVVVRDKEIKEKLCQAALGQDPILSAPVVFVFFADILQSSQKYGVRGEKMYSLQDATIAASYAQLAAADLGLGIVWIGAFEDGEIRAVLNAPKELVPVAILPVGYPAEKPEKTERKRVEDLVKWEKF